MRGARRRAARVFVPCFGAKSRTVQNATLVLRDLTAFSLIFRRFSFSVFLGVNIGYGGGRACVWCDCGRLSMRVEHEVRT